MVACCEIKELQDWIAFCQSKGKKFSVVSNVCYDENKGRNVVEYVIKF